MQATSDLLETYASFVPAWIVRSRTLDPVPITAPSAERFPAAVLFADISGSTSLAERLAQHGAAGAEELGRLLNIYFGQLINTVTANGGDVITFAGDALLACWPAAVTGEELSTATRRAAQCGLAMQDNLHDYEVAEGLRLRLRVGIGSGEVLAATVGGVGGRWEFLVAGTPLVQMSLAGHQAEPGHAVVAPEAWVHLREHCAGRLLPKGGVRLEAVNEPLPIQPLATASPGPGSEVALRGYIPNAILPRLEAGQIGWLAEHRETTVLFLRLIGLDYLGSDALDRLQEAMQAIQNTLYRYGGSISRFSVDDKGTVLLAAFGLPPRTHEDDPTRAVLAATALQAALCKLDLECGIGIATGTAFCGSIGSSDRREYTTLGDVVNTAARLMEASQNDILCNAATQQVAHGRIAFQALPQFSIRGKADPIAVYRALGDAKAAKRAPAMVGRTAEKAVLTGYLDRLQEGLSGVILIEGQPGIGKSRLVADLLQQASARGLAGWVGAGEALEESTPYHAWRPIFLHLFGMDEAMEPEARRARVLKRLATEPETLRLAPLLNAVMALDLEENEVTRELTGEVRADNTHDLLVRLLQSAEPAAPLLLVLEDAQWLDSASWALALQASKHVQPLLLVMAARPMDSHQPEPYLNLREASGTQRLVLDALSLDNTRQLLAERLGVSRLAEPLVALIHDWAEGNPFFTEELAYFLRDRGLIRVTDGVCRIAPNVGDVTLSSLPKSIEVVIASRIGQLTAEQQFTLKVASAVGRAFPYRLLKDIYPIDVDGAQLHKDLDALEHLGIIAPVSTAASLTYMFRQVITRRVVYRRLPFSLRRQLHRAIAEWYERSYADDLSPFFALLAHHWYRVTGLSAEPELELPVEGDLLRPLKVEGAVRAPSTAEVDSYAVAKTIDYYEKAGEQALRNFANEEAVAFFSRARDLDALAGHPSDSTRRACWELQLGEAYANRWSQYPEGRRHLEAGLSLLGQPVPSGLLGQVAGLGGQVFRQVVYRLQSPAPPSRSPERRATLLAAARAYEMLAEVYYFAGETILALIAALRALNLAEAAGPSPELARGFASVGALMGLIPQRGMAEAYARRALEAVAEAGNLPTQAFVSLTSGFYHAGTGAWTGALEHFEKVVKISEHLGDRRRYEDGLSNLMCMSYLQGRFSHGAEVAQRLYESAVRRGDASYQANGLQGKANCLLQLGRFDEAMECLRASQGLLAEQTKVPDEMLGVELHGLLSLAYLRQCEWDQALEATEQVMEAVTATMPSNYGAFPAYANAPEVYLTLWEAEHPAPQLDAQAHKACRALQGYARVFPVGQPRALLWQGLFAWLSGNQAKAHDAWRKSLAAAENLAMPYDQGLAHYEIGRHLQKDDPNRGQTLSRAGEFFEELGAAYHLNLVQAKLVEV